jgi:hypothetical protein
LYICSGTAASRRSAAASTRPCLCLVWPAVEGPAETAGQRHAALG